jgi:CRISPR-associated endonuclease Cas2
MSNLAQTILEELFRFEIRYKGGTSASLAKLFDGFGFNQNSFKSSITRLHKKGLIKRSEEGWFITNEGKNFLSNNINNFVDSPFDKNAKKDLIVMFDIPENYRRYRDWLRGQLIMFGYIMIQQSVWVGPSPLPPEFKKHIKKLRLNNSIRTFKLAKGYVKK